MPRDSLATIDDPDRAAGAHHRGIARICRHQSPRGSAGRLQEALILAQPGDEVVLGEGRFVLDDGLSLDVDKVTLRGAGMNATVLDFTGQKGAGEGLLVTSDNVTLRDFALENPHGDGIKSKGADNIVYQRVRVTWTGGPKETNGAYGLYPVESNGVLIEGSEVSGASDAGIYVGQSKAITVRGNVARHNVAGIEIENSRDAVVEDNFVTGNTGGILVFDLPSLPVMGGGNTVVRNNLVAANTTPNFAPKGNIVAGVRRGTGIMVMANDGVMIEGNTIVDNPTAPVMVVAYPMKFDDKTYNPYPRNVTVGANIVSTRRLRSADRGPRAVARRVRRRAAAGAVGRARATRHRGGAGRSVARRVDARADQRRAAVWYWPRQSPVRSRSLHRWPGPRSPASVRPPRWRPGWSRDPAARPACRAAVGSGGDRARPRHARAERCRDRRRAACPRRWRSTASSPTPAKQTPAARVTPYRLNTPLYSDGAEKLRFVYLPAGMQAKAQGEGLLDLPVGAALIKTFAFPENGKRRLIETRVLLHRADGWIALPYLWNAEQTEAKLALAGARVRGHDPGGRGDRVPRAEQEPVQGMPRARRRGDPDRAQGAQPVGRRGSAASPRRACSTPCLRSRGRCRCGRRAPMRPPRPRRAPISTSIARIATARARPPRTRGSTCAGSRATPRRSGVMKRPVAAGRGAGDLLFDVVPGHPEQSILAHRMNSLEGGVAMPELGKSTRDPEGIAAVEKWISGL